MYIYQEPAWPGFYWDAAAIEPLLGAVRHRQGRLLGQMDARGFALRNEATLEALTLDVLKTSEIEGEILASDQVRSSLARRLGLDVAGLVAADRHVEGVVEPPHVATGNKPGVVIAKDEVRSGQVVEVVIIGTHRQPVVAQIRLDPDMGPMRVAGVKRQTDDEPGGYVAIAQECDQEPTFAEWAFPHYADRTSWITLTVAARTTCIAPTATFPGFSDGFSCLKRHRRSRILVIEVDIIATVTRLKGAGTKASIVLSKRTRVAAKTS